MLEMGDRFSEATVWTALHERTSLHDVVRDGRALFLFYLFDWSST